MPRKGWRKPTTRRELRVSLDDLTTSAKERAGGWVARLELTARQQKDLGRWLDAETINGLLSRMALQHQLYLEERKNPPPTLGEVRAHLGAIQQTAEALATMLSSAHSSVRAHLYNVNCFHFRRQGAWRGLVRELRTLADGCKHEASGLPSQSYRRAHPFLVSQVAELLALQGVDIPASSAPGSRFYKICRIAFDLVGIPFSPKGSIDAYIAEMKRALEE